MVRKFTKSKAVFPTDDSIRKVIYMSVREIAKKWTMPVHDWGLAYQQFAIWLKTGLRREDIREIIRCVATDSMVTTGDFRTDSGELCPRTPEVYPPQDTRWSNLKK